TCASLENISFCLKMYRICKIKFVISSRAKVSSLLTVQSSPLQISEGVSSFFVTLSSPKRQILLVYELLGGSQRSAEKVA
ncbi:MAG: hypothetical protein WC966_11110, partial [Bradymonadales bacterium]